MPKKLTAREHWNKAVRYYFDGDLAIADYKAAQKLDPANAFAKAGLARLGATP